MAQQLCSHSSRVVTFVPKAVRPRQRVPLMLAKTDASHCGAAAEAGEAAAVAAATAAAAAATTK